MNIRVRLTVEETRSRILDVAEEHFRRVGYAKTAVADLADVLGMSSANIYRFFSSKSAINDAICRKMLAEGQALAEQLVAGPGSVSQRLSQLVTAAHEYNKSRFTDEHRLHDMAEVAMRESWPAVEEHCNNLKAIIAKLLREGIVTGEFASCDADETAETIFASCTCLFHPSLIAEHADKDQKKLALNMTAFILRALTNHGDPQIQIKSPGKS